jgi:endonuclease/exonuclease/phosphatase family metal-dependent hydrolase
MNDNPERVMRKVNREPAKPFSVAGVLILITLVSPVTVPTILSQERTFMFYNVENLFDTIDSRLDDDEFLPSSPRKWGSYRYYSKLNNLFRVIVTANGWELPDVIGLCEVENRSVLDDLLNYTYLSRHSYTPIFAGSADIRGIGVALLVDTNAFTITDRWIVVPVSSDGEAMDTRSVLFARLSDDVDTITVVVTHWPSRWGGVAATDPLRARVASVISGELGSVRERYGRDEKILLMGDLNSEPEDRAVSEILGAAGAWSDTLRSDLRNISRFDEETHYGSYKYNGVWSLYDQIIVSQSLISAVEGYFISMEGYKIFNDDFLLVPDKTYNGYKPFRTWRGPVWEGGYSDHLPVLVTLNCQTPEME